MQWTTIYRLFFYHSKPTIILSVPNRFNEDCVIVDRQFHVLLLETCPHEPLQTSFISRCAVVMETEVEYREGQSIAHCPFPLNTSQFSAICLAWLTWDWVSCRGVIMRSNYPGNWSLPTIVYNFASVSISMKKIYN